MSDLVSGFASGFGRALPQGADFVQNREALRQRQQQAVMQNQQAQQEMDMRRQQMDAAARQNGFKNMNEAISGQDAAITEYAGAIAEARGRVGAPGSTVTPDLIDRMNQNLQVMINNRNRLGQTANGILGQDVVQPLDQNAVLAQTEGPGFQEATQTGAAQAAATAAAQANRPQTVPGGSFNPATNQFVANPDLAAAQQAQQRASVPPNIGTIPAGMELVQTTDPDTGQTVSFLRAIPGSPVEREQQAAAEAAQQARQQEQVRSNVVRQIISEALSTVQSQPLATGLPALITSRIPGTSAGDLGQALQSIRANLGFEQLQAMREASPTGGALGPVSDRENQLLQATLGSLEQTQSEQALERNLKRVANALAQIVDGAGLPGSDAPLPYPEVSIGEGSETASPEFTVDDINAMNPQDLVNTDFRGVTDPAVRNLINRRLDALVPNE